MTSDSIVSPLSTINAISNNFVNRKNYYSNHSFPDIQLKERNYQLAASYNGSSFYELYQSHILLKNWVVLQFETIFNN